MYIYNYKLQSSKYAVDITDAGHTQKCCVSDHASLCSNNSVQIKPFSWSNHREYVTFSSKHNSPPKHVFLHQLADRTYDKIRPSISIANHYRLPWLPHVRRKSSFEHSRIQDLKIIGIFTSSPNAHVMAKGYCCCALTWVYPGNWPGGDTDGCFLVAGIFIST